MVKNFNQLQSILSGARDILLVAHRNPDPDTVGGALAFGDYLKNTGKNVSYFCADKLPTNFYFLAGSTDFSAGHDLFLTKHDLTIFVDCGEISRAGIPNALASKQNPWIKIDHHLTSEPFMDLEIRYPHFGATCELIFQFFEHAGFGASPAAATALLAGILTDTTFLSNAATSDATVKTAGRLVALGADYGAAIRAFQMNKNLELLKLWGAAFARLKYDAQNRLATTALFKDDLQGTEPEEALSGLSGFLIGAMQTDAVAIYFESPKGIRGSLRSVTDDFNVSKMAEIYGGGGHKKAAGFTCMGKILEKENTWTIEKI
jgi:phosphoesterase RecJ-like protein